ncbi:MAG: serine acetyltransferase [Alistipes senegalensis]|nr:serine acetyltransferase [Alistipes senegalensis]
MKNKFFSAEYLYDTECFWKYKKKYFMAQKKLTQSFYKIKMFNIMKKCHCLIPISEKINYFSTPHGLIGIYISFGAEIGTGCTIFHNVTIGSNTLSDSKGYGAPVIGNNVYIGTGATIIGNVIIGDNARIGANCIVVEDVPKNATVVMPKAHIITHPNSRSNEFKYWKEK